MCAAGRWSTSTYGCDHRNLLLDAGCCLGFSLLLRHQLGLSHQRGLVASARRPASASLHHQATDGFCLLLGGGAEVRVLL